jgi:hypothetical protein
MVKLMGVEVRIGISYRPPVDRDEVLAAKQKSRTASRDFFAVTFGSPAFLGYRTRDFPPMSSGRFGFIVCGPYCMLE